MRSTGVPGDCASIAREATMEAPPANLTDCWGTRGELGQIVRAVALLASLRSGWAVALGRESRSI